MTPPLTPVEREALFVVVVLFGGLAAIAGVIRAAAWLFGVPLK